jgi:DNA sulfur modification protein DndB
MAVTSMDPLALVRLVAPPDVWNPLGRQAHGNRPRDKGHQKGIAAYLQDADAWVIGSCVLYASSRDAKFVRDDGWEDNGTIAPGRLSLMYGAEFAIGDGQHRIFALADVLKAHDEEGDPVMDRLRASGIPAIVVIENDSLHRAQDFTDLQKNVKAPTASLALSMDRRQAINRFVVDLVQREELPLFDGGKRVEFLKDSPGKLSEKLFSFKTIRYITGTALIGVGQRSASSWERAANEYVEAYEASARSDMIDMWKALSTIPALKAVADGTGKPSEVRADTLLASAGVQYAIAYAIYRAHEDGMPYDNAAKRLAKVNFNRPRVPTDDQPITQDDTLFAGNLIDPETGKIGSGRPAWEAAGDILHKVIVGK